MAVEAKLAILFGVGVLTGFINILAGGGSLITLPVLIFLGLPGTVANGSNRVAILIQNLVAVASFRQLNIFPWRVSLVAVGPALFGVLIGANLAVHIPDHLFKQILAAIMIGVMLIIWLDPAHRFKLKPGPLQGRRLLLFAVAFFAIGIYGGFIQAGAGFIIISVLLLAGFDLVQTNAIKVLVVFIFTLLALAIFILHGQVNYLYGVFLGLGSATGAFIATRVAVKKGHQWIKGFVVAMVFIFAAKLFMDTLK